MISQILAIVEEDGRDDQNFGVQFFRAHGL
jgi:hypothetical protein